MEEVSYFFSSSASQGFEQNIYLREFEYLITLIDPDKIVYTNQEYPEKYLNFLESFTQVKAKFSNNKNIALNWNYYNSGTNNQFESKINFYQYLKKNDIYNSFQIITEPKDIDLEFLYKRVFGYSGKGIFKYPKDSKKIIHLLQSNERLIKERELLRIKDFSALIYNNEIQQIYENIIDDSLGYKGSVFSDEDILSNKQLEEYQTFIKNLISEKSLNDKTYSIDSFLYKSDNVLKLFHACEINMRRSMGYIAHKLKGLYFENIPFFVFRLYVTKNVKNYIKQRVYFNGKVIRISPDTNMFQIFLFSVDNRDEFNRLETNLINR